MFAEPRPAQMTLAEWRALERASDVKHERAMLLSSRASA